MGRNMLFITGTNVERTSIKNYRQAISHDPDIKKLIRKGIYLIKLKPIVSMSLSIISLLIIPVFKLLLSFYQAMLSSSIGGVEIIKIFFSFDITLVPKTTAALFFALSIIQYVKAGKDYRKEFKEKKPTLRRALKFVFCAKAPKTALELWDILQASIMDAQLTTSAERLFDTDVSLIYGGMPYYHTILLDSIFISWKGSETANPNAIRKHYKQFFKEFSRRTILGEIEQKYFFDENHLQVSNCVFGILFLSEYLQSFIAEFFPKSEGKFYIDCDDLKTDSSVTNSEKKSQVNLEFDATREIMGYATNPTFFTFSNQECTQDRIKIHQIDFIGTKSIFGSLPVYTDAKNISAKIKMLLSNLRAIIKNVLRKIQLSQEYYKNGVIRIPLKKLIAIPYGQYDIENPLPQTLSFAGVQQPTKALVLGGAEQNIILSVLINKFKWMNDRNGISDSDFNYYGFAESAFDTRGLLQTQFHNRVVPDGVEYLIGTEGSVYGIPTRDVRGKLIGKDHCRYAEIFKLKINELTYYFIYGYHAVATKIATLKYFVYLSEQENELLSSTNPERITYKLSCPLGKSFELLRKFWDEGDPINSNREYLLAKLKNISTN